jgi:hypothetical protein
VAWLKDRRGEMPTNLPMFPPGRPPDVMPSRLPRTYPVAGTLEPFFLANAARWAAALRDATADVVMSQRAAGHDDEMWRREFPLMIRWAFGRTSCDD